MKLISIIIHIGERCDSGHYIAIGRLAAPNFPPDPATKHTVLHFPGIFGHDLTWIVHRDEGAFGGEGGWALHDDLKLPLRPLRCFR